MKRKTNRIRIIITYLTAYLITFSTIIRSQSGFQGKSFQTPVTIPITIFVILFVIEPLLSRQSHRLTHIYLGVQTIVVSYLILIPPYADYFAVLFVAIIMQAIFVLPEKIGIRWVIAITLIMTGLILYGHGIAAGIGYIINYILSNLIIAGLLIFSDRAETARNESQRLLVELQAAHEKLQVYTAQAEELAVCKERNRLARDLHDSVAQSLHSSTLMAEAGQRLADSGDNERAKGYLIRLGEISQQALREMRLLVYELRPLALNENGLTGALQQRLDAVERRAGVEVQLSMEENLELPTNIEEELYRVAMEALNNALKHATPTTMTVSLRKDENRDIPRIELSIMDDGMGFDPDAKDDEGGLGLVSMRERIDKLGGELTIISAPGEGTQVKACVNLETPSLSPDAEEV